MVLKEEKNLKKDSVWLPALSGLWKSLKKSYCFKLLAMAQSEDVRDRLKAVQLLGRQTKLKGTSIVSQVTIYIFSVFLLVFPPCVII
jgi:hypothetical protein